MDDSFCWEDLDQRRVSPKLSELAQEMQKRAAEAPGLIAFETAKSGNSARYVPQLLKFHEQLADEWVAKAYIAHCDAWNQRGEFYRRSSSRCSGNKVIAILPPQSFN
jgi:hypothetical protein